MPRSRVTTRKKQPVTKPKPVTVNDLVASRRLYPVAEAAQLLGMHRTTLYNRSAEGSITLLRIGSRTYVAADEIERYIRAALPIAHTARPA
jgi:excisionase family DNA binding protein